MRTPDSGIYQITNTRNGDRYIGQATNLHRRKKEHWCALRCRKHFNRRLQRAWDKYGEQCFEYRTLERCPLADLDHREQWYLDNHSPEYNAAKWVVGHMRGLVHSADTRARMSMSQRGKILSPEHKARIGASNSGKVPSPEVRAKMSQDRKGRKHSPETRAKMSASQVRRQAEGPRTPRPPATPATRRRLHDARVGKTNTPESKAKVAESLRRFHAAKRLRQVEENRDWKPEGKGE